MYLISATFSQHLPFLDCSRLTFNKKVIMILVPSPVSIIIYTTCIL